MMAESFDTSTECLTQRVLAVGDAIGTFIEWWGFKAIHGRIWVLLCLSAKPLHQREIAELLSVSKASVSLAIAELVDYRLVRTTGDQRSAPYEANINVWSTISDVLREREWMILERIHQTLEAAVQEARRCKATGIHSPFSLTRLKMLLAMTNTAKTLLKTLLAVGEGTRPNSLISWIKRAATALPSV